jgi:16S rRNA (uracil1498-N3)-methyltransferase
VTLAIALLKGKKFDTVVRQATELGVDTIIPVVTKHCVSRPGPEELEKKRRRWEQIAVEAAQQSGRSVLPTITGPCSLKDMPRVVDATDPSVCAIAFHEGGQVRFPEDLRDGSGVAGWYALIGPEGGLAPEEVALLERRGWFVRRLRFPVLRAETAVIAVGALVAHLRSHYNSRLPGSQTNRNR